MSEGEKNGDSGGMARFSDSEGVVTYKRRKRNSSSPGSGSVLQEDPTVSSGDQKATEVQHALCDGTDEMDGLTRIEHHRKAILKEMLLSDDLNDDGILFCIQKALAFGNLSLTADLNAHAAQAKYTHEGNANLYAKAVGVNKLVDAAKKQEVAFSEFKRETSEQVDAHVINKKCQNVLLEVLASEKFAFLCNLILGNFPGIKASSIIDFSQIKSKMKSKTYRQSVGHFHQDLQQVWERIQKIGLEMALLATSLSSISQTAYQKQRPNGFGAENSIDSHTTIQFPYESEPSTKPEQTEVSCLYKVSICKQCGTDADGQCSLICDGCEATYHFSCVKSTIERIPTQNWYCSTCTRKSEADITNTHQGSPHQNCAVCDRLKVLRIHESQKEGDGENPVTANNSGESSDSSMDCEGPPQPSSSTSPHLCKICRTCEDDEQKFILCSHSFCPYKYYHIRCLRTSQIASRHQHSICWYCPSCLCQACLTDKDDEMIVMCDGCDEAYHTYCMKPPRISVPEGKWYCLPCNVLRAREGMRRYEQWVLQQHRGSAGKLTGGSGR